jgi:hypothetical protein
LRIHDLPQGGQAISTSLGHYAVTALCCFDPADAPDASEAKDYEIYVRQSYQKGESTSSVKSSHSIACVTWFMKVNDDGWSKLQKHMAYQSTISERKKGNKGCNEPHVSASPWLDRKRAFRCPVRSLFRSLGSVDRFHVIRKCRWSLLISLAVLGGSTGVLVAWVRGCVGAAAATAAGSGEFGLANTRTWCRARSCLGHVRARCIVAPWVSAGVLASRGIAAPGAD